MKSKILHILCVLSLLLSASCKDELKVPGPIGGTLKNDCIKRSIGPNVASLQIEFVYAMALPRSDGKILSAKVEASIDGADGTWMENNSYHTNSSGVDIPVLVGNPSVTSGTKTEVVFTADTSAAALRYYYIIPEAAKGKEVSFVFSAEASNGEIVSYSMGPYPVAMMDIQFDLVLTDDNTAQYLSLADMAVLDETTAAANPGKVDLVYLYRVMNAGTTNVFGHALLSPGADAGYFPTGVTLPAGANNATRLRKFNNTLDRHLNRNYGQYVWDNDLITIALDDMPLYALTLPVNGGVWAQTQDGKYKAFVYVNEQNPGTSGSKLPANSIRISMKRYTMK